MSLAELDKSFLDSISALHSREHLKTNKPSYLQLELEECIRQSTGIVKDLSPYTMRNRHVDEIRDDDIVIDDDNKLASNSELELALLKDDLMCIICNGMDVAARNRLLECSECHSLYHQECHQPPVILFEPDDTWTCQKCEDLLRQKGEFLSPIEVIPGTMVPTSKYVIKKSPPLNSIHANSTGVSGILKLSNLKAYAAPPILKTNVTSVKYLTKPSTSTNTSSNNVKKSSNSTILSADKRLQIMKKKAAKLHEKRKLSR